MKKLLKLILLTVVIGALLCISAFASDYDHCADALNELGLFSGTGQGYELDRAPNRAEASVMLVRLLGQENAAKELTYSAPFTDVPEWAQPYVQYLYDNGLAAGTSETTFGSGELCTAQQYATFLLRALGYSDQNGKDFTFANALDFGEELGLVDMFNCDPQDFLRDHVVAMSYTALATAPKTGEADLLTRLVNTGAVKDAKGYDKLFQTYRDFNKAYAAVYSDQNRMSMDMDMLMKMKSQGINVMDANVKMNIAMALDQQQPDKSKMAMTMDLDMKMSDDLINAGFADAADSQKMTMKYYFSDGYAYTEMDGQKIKMAYSIDELLSDMPMTDTASNTTPLCLLRSITADKSGSTTTYHVTMAEGPFNSLFVQLLGMMGQDAETEEIPTSMSFEDMTMDVTVRNNAMTGMKLGMAMQMTQADETIDMSIDATITNIKIGSGVAVSLPSDLNTYLDVTDFNA